MIRKANVSWFQKCKIKWAMEGDCNMGFFNRMVNERRNKNHIGHLFLENGVCTSDREEIEGEILKFFSTLCSPEVSEKPFVEGIDWSLLFCFSTSVLSFLVQKLY